MDNTGFEEEAMPNTTTTTTMTMRLSNCVRAGVSPLVERRCRGCLQRLAALAGALALTACGGGGGGSSQGTGNQVEPAAPLLSRQYFNYRLTRDGAADIVPTVGYQTLQAGDGGATDLRLLEGSAGTGTREGFGTVADQPSATPSFSRYGFWGEHGYGAVLIVTAPDTYTDEDGQRWNRSSRAAHAWVAGDATATNPTGSGSASWQGIAEAVRTDDLQRLMGTAILRIPDLAVPRLNADITLKDHGTDVALQWQAVQLTNGSFQQGTPGQKHLHGRFHGPGHSEAWGVFDTQHYVGAFGTTRQQQ
ncbi:MAG: hypothetical protein F4157_03010 [Synechococcus sp. SB0675_bin_6]|nr:hypothetical protein [Synechococcus sp. SB0675_bin_6]